MSDVSRAGLSLLLQSTLLLSLGLTAAWLLRRRGPALRALVLQMTLLGVALGSMLSVCLVGRIQPMWTIPAPTLPSPIGTPLQRERLLLPASRLLGQAERARRQSGTGRPHSLPSPVHPNNRDAGEMDRLAGPEGAPPPSPLPLLTTTLWATGTGLLLLWLAICQGHLILLRRQATPLTDGRAAEMLARLSAAHPVRAPRLFAAPHVRSPFLAGFWRPAVFLPATWDADYDDMTLHVILSHELAHHTRRDCAWTLLLRLTTALLWPQPLLWLLGRQLDQATEEACDLLSLTPDCPPRRYAAALLTLAERVLPSRTEGALGASVIPIRSAVGRRIQQLLQLNHLLPVTPRLHLLVGVPLGIAALAAAVVFVLPAPTPGFSWAKAQGWDVQPVRMVRLEPRWLQAFEPIPRPLTQRDYAPIRACWVNPSAPFEKIYYGKDGTTIALRQLYQRAVTQFPGSFYPEHCLAEWYAEHQDMPQYKYWEQRALLDAPAIIAGQVVFDDGTPVAHASLSIGFSTYDTAHTSMPRAFAFYDAATTDDEGCYYLPVYKGIYSPQGPNIYGGGLIAANNQRYNICVSGPALSAFDYRSSQNMTLGVVSISHVGVLPTIVARPPMQFTTQIGRTLGSSQHPIVVQGNTLNLAWKTQPKARCYTASISDNHRGLFSPVSPTEPIFVSGSRQPVLNLPLNGSDTNGGKAPLFDRATTYTLVIFAHSSDNPSGEDWVNTAGPFIFRPASAVAPLPLTPEMVQNVFGAGTLVTSIVKAGNLVTITGTAPADVQWKWDSGDACENDGKFFSLNFMRGDFGIFNTPNSEPFKMVFRR